MEQVVPLCPHDISLSPDRHWPCSQQPLQLAPLQASATHLPFVHDCALAHTEQEEPLAPQLVTDVCSTHLPFLQQPLQVAGPHDVGTGGSGTVPPASSAQPAASTLRPAANSKEYARDRAMEHLVVGPDL